ncbi:hypothetical protein CHARACLAT_025664 [Characodon lateralis]|uniref:Uncharacterized protein n=1 Tax=Characodon lateralis TaxID=208331 RepID=A0ABU7EM94_9TELE|nr:hypothetical protein [Characodon lateralis]
MMSLHNTYSLDFCPCEDLRGYNAFPKRDHHTLMPNHRAFHVIDGCLPSVTSQQVFQMDRHGQTQPQILGTKCLLRTSQSAESQRSPPQASSFPASSLLFPQKPNPDR